MKFRSVQANVIRLIQYFNQFFLLYFCFEPNRITYDLRPGDLLCPLFHPKDTQSQSSNRIRLKKSRIWREGSSIGASSKLFRCRLRPLALVTAIASQSISRCLGDSSKNLQNASSKIPSLWRCPLRVQCSVRNPVNNLRLFLQRFEQTLDLLRSKSPIIPWSISVHPYPSRAVISLLLLPYWFSLWKKKNMSIKPQKGSDSTSGSAALFLTI